MRIKPINRPEETDPELIRVQRDHVLKYASDLTTERSDPDAVVGNAEVLLAWISVGDPADRDARYRALSRAHHNRGWDRKPDDDPALLITEAEVFYAFLKAA